MILTRREAHGGQEVPGWYGLAYDRYDLCASVYYPIPLNVIVGVSREVYFWLRWKWNPGWMTAKIERAYSSGIDEGRRGCWEAKKRAEEADKRLLQALSIMDRILGLKLKT